ncbi:Type 1 glutamine amidotransferase-like domain-containing protein [Clostridiaceae bacterium M8S5]|nr:Type 1 glutamine amidotransferase-like domain-containing protein [Clostridiaceae bacterium M8S5]
MIILNGGSYYPESLQIDKEWTRHISKQDLISFIPSATVRSKEEYLVFFKKYMKNYELTNIISLDLYEIGWKEKLKKSKVIFIAGGNTYKLLDIVRQSGFDEFIRDRHEDKIIIGNSAGAVIMGLDIVTANSNDIIGLSNTKGMGLVNYSICPHYTSHKYAKLLDKSNKLKHEIIGLPEESAIIIDGDKEHIINEIEIIKGCKK